MTALAIIIGTLVAALLDLFNPKPPRRYLCAVCGKPAESGERCRKCRLAMDVKIGWHWRPDNLDIPTVARIYTPPPEPEFEDIPF